MTTTNDNRICRLFGIDLPIVAGGMAWCSGWRLAAAASNAGCLGLLGAGSMHPETLREHIAKLKDATTKPWGVNIPLMYPEMSSLIDIIIEMGVNIVVTSAGSPKKFTNLFHDHGIKVAHVVSSSLFARKCEEAGVDAVIAEGFEAGGHNGREETTTMALIPKVCQTTNLPVVAAGGIASGGAIMAAQSLGAEGVQIGTLFAVSKESSASDTFKQWCLKLDEGDTMLCLKRIAPTRMAKNALYERIAEAENRGADIEELRQILGRTAAKRGIFEGDTVMGEIEIGQAVASISEIRSVADIVEQLKKEYIEAYRRINAHPFIKV